jgi:hypothetical protein
MVVISCKFRCAILSSEIPGPEPSMLSHQPFWLTGSGYRCRSCHHTACMRLSAPSKLAKRDIVMIGTHT